MNVNDMCHVMIDLETLGTKRNSVIMSIAAVQFDLKGNTLDRFHVGVSIDSCLKVGLQVDEDTIKFWLNQEKENVKKLFSLKTVSLKEALFELKNCFALSNKEDIYVWSHGSVFDVVMLENAYQAVGMNAWWKYSNVRDTRTLFDLAEYSYKAVGTHDALEDARNQARAVQEAYFKLSKKWR